MHLKTHSLKAALALAALAAFAPAISRAHCDSMDGPVVAQALDALASGDVAPTLKWVRAQDEAELREAFQRALAVRQLGAEAAELSDRYFLETLVRIHREGEGAPYTGLRPAGQLEPVYVAADGALDDGSADRLAGHVAHEVESAIASRFAEAMELRAHAESSPEAGREYVAAYVRYMHFVEAVHELLAHGEASGHEGH
jgi:hypothetical protein